MSAARPPRPANSRVRAVESGATHGAEVLLIELDDQGDALRCALEQFDVRVTRVRIGQARDAVDPTTPHIRPIFGDYYCDPFLRQACRQVLGTESRGCTAGAVTGAAGGGSAGSRRRGRGLLRSARSG